MGGALESNEELQSAIQILKGVAEKFRALDEEAEVLLAKKDAAGYDQKLRERARLLIDLPGQLSGDLEGVDPQTKQKILQRVSSFAALAKDVLESEGTFGLGVLLTHMGDKIGDRNDLENLIASLESK